MLENPSFYTVIIGTELLNGRRKDGHFEFVNKELLKRGWTQKANFVIKDDPEFLADVYRLVKSDKNSVMFSFGGIGSTPDDFTREISSEVFSDGLVRHNEAEKIIIDKMGEDAYPHRIKMADLPSNAKLLENPINKMPGYYVKNRFFFVPGFVSMAHPMVEAVLDKFYPKAKEKFSCNFDVFCGEADIIDIMEELPSIIELSCLPQFVGDERVSEIFLSSYDEDILKESCLDFKNKLNNKQIKYKDK